VGGYKSEGKDFTQMVYIPLHKAQHKHFVRDKDEQLWYLKGVARVK
jgi:hypothetical protein